MLMGDFHVHTNLSLCGDRNTTAATYLPLCETEQVRVLGFSNHAYYAADGTSGATAMAPLRAEIDVLQPQTNIRLLLGAEVENVVGKPPSLLPEEVLTARLDYVLIAASHIGNQIPTYYAAADFSTPQQIRERLLERFFAACALQYPVPCGICHPLYPICFENQAEIISGISDSVLADCFTAARQGNKSIEIHACLTRHDTPLGADGLSPTYMRLLQAARACGCKFHFGSDAHRAADFENAHRSLYLAAEKLALCDDDFAIFAGIS